VFRGWRVESVEEKVEEENAMPLVEMKREISGAVCAVCWGY
jgi:hypothetical protein